MLTALEALKRGYHDTISQIGQEAPRPLGRVRVVHDSASGGAGIRSGPQYPGVRTGFLVPPGQEVDFKTKTLFLFNNAVLTASDPALKKYFKMLKLHLPKQAVVIKMKADGVDPAFLDMPDANRSFQAEETAEVVILPGSVHSGNWVRCTIKGPGGKPDTFNIHVHTTTDFDNACGASNTTIYAVRKDHLRHKTDYEEIKINFFELMDGRGWIHDYDPKRSDGGPNLIVLSDDSDKPEVDPSEIFTGAQTTAGFEKLVQAFKTVGLLRNKLDMWQEALLADFDVALENPEPDIDFFAEDDDGVSLRDLVTSSDVRLQATGPGQNGSVPLSSAAASASEVGSENTSDDNVGDILGLMPEMSASSSSGDSDEDESW